MRMRAPAAPDNTGKNGQPAGETDDNVQVPASVDFTHRLARDTLANEPQSDDCDGGDPVQSDRDPAE